MIMKNTDDFLIAHVELGQARFTHGEEIGFEFRSEIDAWARMETHFRHQIRNPRKRFSPKGRQDLATIVYSVRHKLDEI
jgi:hypothetical protein